MTYNNHHRTPAHFMYPLLSQLSPLPHAAVMKPEAQLPQHPAGNSFFNRGDTKSISAAGNSSHNAGKSQCPICNSYFSKNTHLKQHIETVHEGQKTQCPICSGHFSRKTDLKRHIETIHEGKRTQCLQCSASFATEQFVMLVL